MALQSLKSNPQLSFATRMEDWTCLGQHKSAQEVITRTTKAGSVETVSPPKVPTTPSGPNISKYLMLGLIAGLAVSVGFALITSFFDNTVKSGEDIKERFGVPVLAEIPDIFMDERGGNGKYGKY